MKRRRLRLRYHTVLTMGLNQIVEKLRREFDGEIASERQVVYILVEIGKLVEHDGSRRGYPYDHVLSELGGPY